MESIELADLHRLQPLIASVEGAVLSVAAVFIRIGAIAYFMPGLGERFTSVRLRLVGAIALTMIVWPLAQPEFETIELRLEGFAFIALAEAACGLVLGLAIRFFIFALQMAGAFAAQSLSISQLFGTGLSFSPEQTIATMLTLSGVALAITLGLHVKVAALVVDSYQVLPFGAFPVGSDVAAWSARRMSDVFNLAVSLALPFIIVAFIYNLSIGFINRAMPQLMVAFVGVPLITWLGLVMLTVTIVGMLQVWHAKFDRALVAPLGV